MSASGTLKLDTSGRIPDEELLGQFSRLRVRSNSASNAYPQDPKGAAYGNDVVIQYVGWRVLRPVTPSEGEPCHRGMRLATQESELCRMAERYVARQTVEDCLRNATTKERNAINSILLRINENEPQAAAEWNLVALSDEYVWSDELRSRGKEFVMILRKQRRGHAWSPSVPTQATKIHQRQEPAATTTQPIQIKPGRQAQQQRMRETPSSPLSPMSKSSFDFPSPRAAQGPQWQYVRPSMANRPGASSLPSAISRSSTTESQISSHLNRMGAIEEGGVETPQAAKQVRFAGAMPLLRGRRNTDPLLRTLRDPREEERLRRERQEMRNRATRPRQSSDVPTKVPDLESSDGDSHASRQRRRGGGWTSGSDSPPTPGMYSSSPHGWQYEGRTSQHFLRSGDRRHSYDMPPASKGGHGRVHVRESDDEDQYSSSRMTRAEEEAAKIVVLDRRLDKLLQQSNRRNDGTRRPQQQQRKSSVY